MASNWQIDHLVSDLAKRRNAALIVGAGVSIPNGIPAGYRLAYHFGRSRGSMLSKRLASFLVDEAAPIEAQRLYIDTLLAEFKEDAILQEELLVWLQGFASMAGGASDDHLLFVVAWLNRRFRHLVTTNWDFLLESQMEAIYDEAYTGDQFSAIEMSLSDGHRLTVEADQLFYPEPLDEDEVAWNPRWDIVVSPFDLQQLEPWARPIWKIHGSPFFLACPQCRGINRWKRVTDLQVGQECPEHPGSILKPEITFWTETLDRSYKPVWKSLRARLMRSDLVVAVGFSGNDEYIREALENHPNLWVVAPTPGAWDTSRVRYIEATGSDLARSLASVDVC